MRLRKNEGQSSVTERRSIRAKFALWAMALFTAVIMEAPAIAASDTTPPTAPKGLAATVASATQINLKWTASTDNVGVTGYRVESCSGASCTTFAQIGTPTTTSYSASGLAAATKYSFRVRATDAAGNLSSYSSTASGTTSTAADTTPPTAPGTPSLIVFSSSQIVLNWAASTDNVGVTGYRVESCSGASCTTFTQIGTPTSNSSYSATGLTASTNYSFRIRATDAAGNLSSYSSTASATTLAAPDTTPPTAPGTPSLTLAAPNQINVTWATSTDNVGVTGYNVERCSGAGCTAFTGIVTSTANSFGDSGLTLGTSYSYRVQATDQAGNLSSYSNTATASTPAPPDTTPPTAPGTPSATASSSTQISLTWAASTDNVGVTGYQVERCTGASCTTFAQIAAPTTNSYTDTGLTAVRSYSYRVSASDAAGNLSSFSGTASATTGSNPTTYNYDAYGHLYSVPTSTGTAYYHYDAAGHLTSVTAAP
jgi:YD repeat-containing protein